MDFKLIIFLTGICLVIGYCQGAEIPSDETSAANLPTETTPSSNSSTTTTTPPQSKTWVVVDKTISETCILAQIILEFNFSYPVEIKANANVTTGDTILIVPLDTSTEATKLCANTSQSITLKCKENSVEIDYKLDEDKNSFVSLNTLNFNGQQNCSEKVLTYKNDAPLLKTQVDMSHKCDKVQQVNITAVSGDSSAILSISHKRFLAPRKKKEDPGLRLWPTPFGRDAESNLLRVEAFDLQSFHNWGIFLHALLEEYRKLPRSENVEKCDYDRPPQPGKVCDFDLEELSPCIKENRYDYMHNHRRSSPCIFLTLSQDSGWRPIMYNDITELPDNMPLDLKNNITHIKTINPKALNSVWVSCEGENPADIENIKKIEYFPKPGFPGYFFPYLNQEGYLSPIVAVRFERPASRVRINIVCKAWAHNIDNDGSESKGSVHFALHVDR